MITRPRLAAEPIRSLSELTRRSCLPATLLLTTALLGGCSGGGSGGGDHTEPGAESVEDTLELLGFDTTEEPLKDDQGFLIPESHSPLGAATTLKQRCELTVIGPRTGDSEAWHSSFDLMDDRNDDGFPEHDPNDPLTTLAANDAPWAEELLPYGAIPVTKRAGTAADIDGDGRDEQVFAHFDAVSIYFTIVQDEVAAFAKTTEWVHTPLDVCLDVEVTSADVNGDGDEEVVLGYSIPGKTVLTAFDFASGSVETTPLFMKESWNPGGSNLGMMELAAGNLDYDANAEFGVVVNEFQVANLSDPSAPPAGGWGGTESCYFRIFDDVESDLDVLSQGSVSHASGGDTYVARSADLDIGDMDADGFDEIAIAGAVYNIPLAESVGRYVLIAQDDYHQGPGEEVRTYYDNPIPNEPYITNEFIVVNWAHVNLVDLTGDRACEIQVNENTFGDFSAWSSSSGSPAAWVPWEKMGAIYPTHWYWNFGVKKKGLGRYVDPSRLSFAVGDFDGDFREDIAVYSHGRSTMKIWSYLTDDNGNYVGFGTSSEHEVRLWDWEGSSGTHALGRNPLVVPIDTDSDATIVEFLDRTYILTEPVIVAALAAAPNITGPGQNVDANETEYGRSTVHGTTSEFQLDWSAGIIVGFGYESPEGSVEAEIEAKVTFEFSHVWENYREITTGISYHGGKEEDMVISSVTAYDAYRYRVVSSPDEEEVDMEFRVLVPRGSEVKFLEREFFNSALVDEALKVDESVFQHTIGDVYSYPTGAEMETIVATQSGLRYGTSADSLGAANSSIHQHIEISEGGSGSDYRGMSTEVEASTTLGGFKIGASVGAAFGHTWTTNWGDVTYIGGTVGSVNAATNLEDGFNWELFCYWHEPTPEHDAFQVVHFAVD